MLLEDLQWRERPKTVQTSLTKLAEDKGEIVVGEGVVEFCVDLIIFYKIFQSQVWILEIHVGVFYRKYIFDFVITCFYYNITILNSPIIFSQSQGSIAQSQEFLIGIVRVSIMLL